MSSGTRPAILLRDLLSGDGPHRDLADRFVAGTCIRCGVKVGDARREGADRGLCEECSPLTVETT
jgi:hypothetical protein